MAKAIKITQDIKDKNAKYNLNFVKNNDVDSIVKTGFPRKFYVTEPVSGGYQTRTDLHESDGWKDIIIPSYNSQTQKLGTTVIEVDDTFTYEVIDLSQEEIDALQEQNEENQAREKIDNYRFRGGEIIEKTRTKMWRRVHLYPNGTNGLTKQQVAKLERWFLPTYSNMLVGNFREAKNKMEKLIELRDDVTGDSSLLEAAGMLDTAIWLRDEVTDYFNDNYDL